MFTREDIASELVALSIAGTCKTYEFDIIAEVEGKLFICLPVSACLSYFRLSICLLTDLPIFYFLSICVSNCMPVFLFTSLPVYLHA